MTFLVAPTDAVSELTGEPDHVVIAEARPVRCATDCEVWLADQLHVARLALQLIARDPAVTGDVCQRIAIEALGKLPEVRGVSLETYAGPWDPASKRFS